MPYDLQTMHLLWSLIPWSYSLFGEMTVQQMEYLATQYINKCTLLSELFSDLDKDTYVLHINFRAGTKLEKKNLN